MTINIKKMAFKVLVIGNRKFKIWQKESSFSNYEKMILCIDYCVLTIKNSNM